MNITIIFKYLGRYIYFMKNAAVTMRKAPFSYRVSDWIYKNNLSIRAVSGPILNTIGLVGLVVGGGMEPGSSRNWAVTLSAVTEMAGIALDAWALADYYTLLNEANKKLREYGRNERIVAGNSKRGS